MNPRPSTCPDCDDLLPAAYRSRRDVLKSALKLTTGAAGLSAAASSGILFPAATLAAPTIAGPSTTPALAPETLVAQLFKTLSDEQKKLIAFPFDHPLRSKVDNNWMITKQPIGKLLSGEQLSLVRDIFRDLHSEEYAQRVYDQVDHDNQEDGGFDACSIALFGEPGGSTSGKSQFEFVFTGRHVTRRCDGNSVAGEAFGGPIFYGHAAQSFREKPDHPGNAYWFQGLRANEVFHALDGKQREKALRDDPRQEHGTRTVDLRGKTDGLPGIGVADLASDQKNLVRKVMADLLAPFRKPDADAALRLIEDGGFDNLHMAFYKNMDIGNDGVWDVWQLEGPSMVWYFRGAPHVHTWVHIRKPERV